MTSAFVQPYSKPPAHREAGGKVVLLQPRGKPPHLCVLSFFHSHILYEAVPPLVCLLLVCSVICFEL